MASGQCYGCGTTFGIFRKEHGCKNCGFAFCSRCLPKTIAVPKLDNAKHHVCNRCHEILTGKAARELEKEREKEKEMQAPPDAYFKRMAALQDRASCGSHYNYGMSYTYTPSAATKAIPVQYRGLSRADADIAQRLEKLKEKPQNQPIFSDKEITDRLSKLKGVKPDPKAGQKKTTYHPPERRSEQEQIDDLLNEIHDEVEIDAKFDPAKEVEERLVRFKDEPPRKTADKKPSGGNNLNLASSAPKKPYSKNIDQATGPATNKGLALEDINSLIAATAKEMEVDAQKALDGLAKDKEIMERLHDLRKKKNAKGEGSEEENEQQTKGDNSCDIDSEDEEEAAKKIIKMYLEEVKLEERLGDIPSIDGQPTASDIRKMSSDKPKTESQSKPESEPITKKKPSDDVEEYDPDELPYCCICTNDATIRCLGCDFDLYCSRCFKESHEQLEMEDHVTVKYTPPKEES